MNDLENTTIRCHQRFHYKKLPGQKYFTSPSECFNSMADTEGYCRGKTFGQSCANNGDADCDVDLHCDERKSCVHVGINGDHCDDHHKCASNLLCAWEDGVNFVCRHYGIYPNGKSLGPGDEDDICQSNYIDEEYYCRAAPRLTSPRFRDSAGEKCEYTAGRHDHSQIGRAHV